MFPWWHQTNLESKSNADKLEFNKHKSKEMENCPANASISTALNEHADTGANVFVTTCLQQTEFVSDWPVSKWLVCLIHSQRLGSKSLGELREQMPAQIYPSIYTSHRLSCSVICLGFLCAICLKTQTTHNFLCLCPEIPTLIAWFMILPLLGSRPTSLYGQD